MLLVALLTACPPPKAEFVEVDTDCDDGEATTWYADADGDGYGDFTTATTSCSAPTGYVTDGSDCDDADAALFPEASGLCADGLDCRDILARDPSATDDTYTIDPDGSGTGTDPFDVRCEMDLDGGGWTQITEEYLDTLSTSVSRNYLYSFASDWYRSPSTTAVWSWTSYEAVEGTYTYGSGATVSGTFDCTSSEEGSWGVGCSTGSGVSYKVIPTRAEDPAAATSTICQDLPDIFHVGDCRTDVSMWARE